LRARPSSPYIGKAATEVDLKDYPGLNLVALLEAGRATPVQRAQLAEGDVVLVRGDAEAAGRLAVDMHLALREDDPGGPVADVLLSRNSGLADAVIPSSS